MVPAGEAAVGYAGFIVSFPVSVVINSFLMHEIAPLAFAFRFQSFGFRPGEGIAAGTVWIALCPALHYIRKES